MTPRPTPIEPHEQLAWDLEAHMDRYRAARDARNVAAARKALDAAQVVYETLGDELGRLREAVDGATEGRAVA